MISPTGALKKKSSHFPPTILGSYERTAQAFHYGTGVTDVHADPPLRRERAVNGPIGGCVGRRGRAAGFQADGGDREAGGGEPGTPQCQNRSAGNLAGDHLSDGAEGFSGLESDQRESGYR